MRRSLSCKLLIVVGSAAVIVDLDGAVVIVSVVIQWLVSVAAGITAIVLRFWLLVVVMWLCNVVVMVVVVVVLGEGVWCD